MSKEITSRTKRLAQILALLEQGPILVQDLSLRFGVSFRTIQRDIKLLLNTQMPLISPSQSIYKFAEGFSLKAVNLSCEETALISVSFDIAKQIGENFSAIQQEIPKRFSPKSFENCIFGATHNDFAAQENLAHGIIESIDKRYVTRVFLKDIRKIRSLYPVKLLRLWDKWYIVSVNPEKEIQYFALENIDELILPTNPKTGTGYNIFRYHPFVDWLIWKKAHQWVIDLKPTQEQNTESSQEVVLSTTEIVPKTTQN